MDTTPKCSFHNATCVTPSYAVLAPISRSCPPSKGWLLTCYSAVCHYLEQSEDHSQSFDLHALSAPPAFVLSQDQTLIKITEHKCSVEKQIYSVYSTGLPSHYLFVKVQFHQKAIIGIAVLECQGKQYYSPQKIYNVARGIIFLLLGRELQ